LDEIALELAQNRVREHLSRRSICRNSEVIEKLVQRVHSFTNAEELRNLVSAADQAYEAFIEEKRVEARLIKQNKLNFTDAVQKEFPGIVNLNANSWYITK
jgi:hypothetical protein